MILVWDIAYYGLKRHIFSSSSSTLCKLCTVLYSLTRTQRKHNKLAFTLGCWGLDSLHHHWSTREHISQFTPQQSGELTISGLKKHVRSSLAYDRFVTAIHRPYIQSYILVCIKCIVFYLRINFKKITISKKTKNVTAFWFLIQFGIFQDLITN